LFARTPSPSPRSALRALLFAGLLTLLLPACAEEAVSPQGAGNGGVADAGSIGIFLTQHPSTAVDRILLTIDRIQLIGEGPPVTIFSGRETIDVSELEHFSDLFVFAEDVAVGPYSKIRLSVPKIQVEYEGVLHEVERPASGNVDLIPSRSFRIPVDGGVMVEIAVDPDKSVLLHVAGNGKIVFRPVIFITLNVEHSPAKLARVHGEVIEIWADDSFVLCSTVYMASRYIPQVDDGQIAGGLGDLHRCIFVETDARTGVFNENGDPSELDELRKREKLTVVGHFASVSADGDLLATPYASPPDVLEKLEEKFKDKKDKKGKGGDSDSKKGGDSDTKKGGDSDTKKGGDSEGPGGPGWPGIDLVVLAAVVERGPADAFLQLGGMIESSPNEDGLFDFSVDPGQDFEPDAVLPALLQEPTRVFSADGVEVGDEELLPETDAEIDGVVGDVGTLRDVLKTALIVLDLESQGGEPGEPGPALSGEIFLIEPDERALAVNVLDNGAEVTRCVLVPQDAAIVLVEATAAGSSLSEGDFADLAREQSVDVYGPSDDAECFVATTVVAYVVPGAP
jgi:hypothetical protein